MSEITVDVVMGGRTQGQVQEQIDEALEGVGSLPEITEGDAGKALVVSESEDGAEWGDVHGIAAAGRVPGQPMIATETGWGPGGPPWTVASRVPLVKSDPVAVLVTTGDSGGTWDDSEVTEPDSPKWDPVTEQWVCAFTGHGTGSTDNVGLLLSDDGEEWTQHPQNPVATGDSEDPYIVRDEDGNVWRDPDGRAWMLTEEKIDGHLHRGILLFRSAAGTLADWTPVGRVIDKGDTGAWDEQDRTSPTAVAHDGAVVVLYEGRDSPAFDANGGVGRAVSTDGGATWTVDPEPLLVGPEDVALVPDDILKVGDAWVVTTHGVTGEDSGYSRWVTLDDPVDWTPEGFERLPSAPEGIGFVGTDPSQACIIGYVPVEESSVSAVMVYDLVPEDPPQGGVDYDDTELRGRVGNLESTVGPLESTVGGHTSAIGNLEGTVGGHGSTLENHGTRIGTAEGTLTAHGTLFATANVLRSVIASVAGLRGDPETGSLLDISTLGVPGFAAFDGASDLDLDAGATLVLPASLDGQVGAALFGGLSPGPVAPTPPVDGAVFLGARINGLQVNGARGAATVEVGTTDGGGGGQGVGYVVAGADQPKWEWSPNTGQVTLTSALAMTGTVDVVLLGPAGAFTGVTIVVTGDGEGSQPTSIQVGSIEWLWTIPMSVLVDIIAAL